MFLGGLLISRVDPKTTVDCSLCYAARVRDGSEPVFLFSFICYFVSFILFRSLSGLSLEPANHKIISASHLISLNLPVGLFHPITVLCNSLVTSCALHDS